MTTESKPAGAKGKKGAPTSGANKARQRTQRSARNGQKPVCRYCGSDDLVPSFITRRDLRCRACFKKHYGSARRKTKVALAARRKPGNSPDIIKYSRPGPSIRPGLPLRPVLERGAAWSQAGLTREISADIERQFLGFPQQRKINTPGEFGNYQVGWLATCDDRLHDPG